MAIQRFSLFVLIFMAMNTYAMNIRSDIKSSFLDMQAKYNALSQTPEFQAYEDAKKAHEQFNTADTQYIVNLCKEELHRTKEYQDWSHAEQQQACLIKNPTNSNNLLRMPQKSYEEQVAEYAQMLEQKAKFAWYNVSKTLEYQRYKDAMMIHEALKNNESLSELKKYKRAAKTTNEYLEYCKAEDEKRILLAKLKGYSEEITIEYNYPTCIVNYAAQQKTLKKLNLKFLPIRTINNSTPSIISVKPVMRIIGKNNATITVYRLT